MFYFLAGGRHRCRYALSGTVFALPDLDDENMYNSPQCSESSIVARHRSRLYRIEVRQSSSTFRLLDLRECLHLVSYICTVASTFIGIALAAGTVSTAILALYSNAPPFSPGLVEIALSTARCHFRSFIAVGIFFAARPIARAPPCTAQCRLGVMNPYGGEGPDDSDVCSICTHHIVYKEGRRSIGRAVTPLTCSAPSTSVTHERDPLAPFVALPGQMTLKHVWASA